LFNVSFSCPTNYLFWTSMSPKVTRKLWDCFLGKLYFVIHLLRGRSAEKWSYLYKTINNQTLSYIGFDQSSPFQTMKINLSWTRSTEIKNYIVQIDPCYIFHRLVSSLYIIFLKQKKNPFGFGGFTLGNNNLRKMVLAKEEC